jgi:hypothetical protein
MQNIFFLMLKNGALPYNILYTLLFTISKPMKYKEVKLHSVPRIVALRTCTRMHMMPAHAGIHANPSISPSSFKRSCLTFFISAYEKNQVYQ